MKPTMRAESNKCYRMTPHAVDDVFCSEWQMAQNMVDKVEGSYRKQIPVERLQDSQFPVLHQSWKTSLVDIIKAANIISKSVAD